MPIDQKLENMHAKLGQRIMLRLSGSASRQQNGPSITSKINREHDRTFRLDLRTTLRDSPGPAFYYVQVTRENFMETLPLVREALSECEFFAFDCEMTGIRDSGLYTDIMHDMDDFFLKVRSHFVLCITLPQLATAAMTAPLSESPPQMQPPTLPPASRLS